MKQYWPSKTAAELSAIVQDFGQSQGWFVYYTAESGRTLFGDAMGRYPHGPRPLSKNDRQFAEAVMSWARKKHHEGCPMAQRKNALGDTEYVLKRKR